MTQQTQWTKQKLVETVNQLVDRNELGFGASYIFPDDISDEALAQFQAAWDGSVMNPAARAKEIKLLYQSIVAGW